MATSFAVDLIFKSQGVGKIQDLSNKLQGVDAKSKSAQKGLDGAGNAAKRAGSKAQAAAGGFNKLAGAVGGLVSAYALLNASKFVFAKTAEIETQTRSIQVLTGSLKEAQSVISELQNFAAVTPFTSSDLIENAKRLKAFGVETEDLVDTTKRLGDIAGATGAELSGLATAYGQVIAKGRLQGEELLQFQERGVALQQELREMYKLSGEEFQDALSKGKISAEAVEVAVKRLTAAGGKYANGAIAQSDTLAGKMSTLQDGIDSLARRIGEVLSPAIKTVLDQAIQTVNTINNLLAAGARAQKFGLNQQAQKGILDQARAEAEEIVNLRRIKDPFERNRVFQEIAAQREKDLIEAYGYKTGQIQAEVKAPQLEQLKVPDLLGGTSGSGSSGGGSSGGNASSFKPSSRAKALIAAAKKLGVSPLDLATIISYETAGTFSPSIRGGHGGNYMGLIQFGAPERQQYGAHSGQSFEEQVMGPVVRFFKDRFAGVGRSTQGASLLDLYKTVNGGNPNVSAGLSDGNGTIGGHVQRMMGGHRQKALSTFFGGSSENVGYSGADAAADMASGWEDMQRQQEIAERLRENAAERLVAAKALLGIEQALTPLQEAQLQTAENKRKIEAEYNGLISEATETETKKTLESAKGIELKLEDVKLEKELKALRENAVQSITEEIAQLQAKLAGKEKEYLLEKQIAALKNAGVPGDQAAALVKQKDALEGQVKAISDQKQLWADVYGVVSNELQGAIKGLIDGTTEWGDVLSNILSQLGSMFISSAFSGIGAGLKLPGFAGGGSTGDGPRVGGLDGQGGYLAMLHPQETVVDHAQGNSGMSEAMRRYSPAAGGSGGAGTSASGSDSHQVVEVKYNVTEINGMRFVTEDQFQAGLTATRQAAAKDGAAAGHTRSMRTLQNSRSQRAKLGMR